jgi:hypothetical protein
VRRHGSPGFALAERDTRFDGWNTYTDSNQNFSVLLPPHWAEIDLADTDRSIEALYEVNPDLADVLEYGMPDWETEFEQIQTEFFAVDTTNDMSLTSGVTYMLVRRPYIYSAAPDLSEIAAAEVRSLYDEDQEEHLTNVTQKRVKFGSNEAWKITYTLSEGTTEADVTNISAAVYIFLKEYREGRTMRVTTAAEHVVTMVTAAALMPKMSKSFDEIAATYKMLK